MNLSDNQVIEVRTRCIEAAARLFQSFDMSRNESARDVTILAAQEFYDWITRDRVTINRQQI